jgi:hypothetical protein
MSKKKRAKAQARHPHTDERLVIRVHLLSSEPEIWRRISLDPELTLYQVHEVLQVIFEWENDHLHDFTKRREGKPNATYAPPWDALKSSPYPSRDVDESTVKLGTLLRLLGSTLHYTYDPMADWVHELTVEERRPALADEPRARLLAGERAGPIEELGSMQRFNEFVADQERLTRSRRATFIEDIEEMTGDELYVPERFELVALHAKLAESLANDLASWDPTVEPVFDVQ